MDLGMGYGRNALWLAEQGYAVEGWETDRRYLAEARREARRRGVRLKLRRGDFTRGRFRGPYDVIVVSNALHLVRRSAALRVLRQARTALVPGGRLFLLAKLTSDPNFRQRLGDPNWQAVPGERNTLRRVRGPAEYRCWRGRLKRRSWLLSALEPAEIKSALRRLPLRQYREVVLRSQWGETVRHHLAELVAQKPNTAREAGAKRRQSR